jgi:hypothetical protein
MMTDPVPYQSATAVMGINQDKHMRAKRLVGILYVYPALGEDMTVFKHIPMPIGTANQKSRWVALGSLRVTVPEAAYSLN